MADITICTAKECPKKENCYRYYATPDEQQSYADFSNHCNPEKGYSEYIVFDDSNWTTKDRDDLIEQQIFAYKGTDLPEVYKIRLKSMII
jgi:hypothetical protein